MVCLVSNWIQSKLPYCHSALKSSKSAKLFRKYSLFCDSSLHMSINKHYSFLKFISKGIAQISNGSLKAWSSLTRIDTLSKSNKPPLFAAASNQNGLWKPGMKNCAVGREVSSLVSATIKMSTCSKIKFVKPETLLRSKFIFK